MQAYYNVMYNCRAECMLGCTKLTRVTDLWQLLNYMYTLSCTEYINLKINLLIPHRNIGNFNSTTSIQPLYIHVYIVSLKTGSRIILITKIKLFKLNYLCTNLCKAN